jgi:uncharacterized membrane protein
VAAILTVLGSISPLLNLGRNAFFYPSLSTLGFGILLAPLGLIGLILFLVAMNGLANDYEDRSIFNNVLYSVLSGIVLAIIAAFVAIFVVFSNIGDLIPQIGTPNSGIQLFESSLESLITILPVISLFGLVPAFFNMRAFNRLGTKSGVRLFRTVGLLGIIAAAASALAGFAAAALFYADIITTASDVLTASVVGSAISLVAWIIAVKAFLSIRTPTSQEFATTAPQASTPTGGQIRYCPNCGTANSADAVFCVKCGKNL